MPTETLKAALAPATHARRPAGVFGFIWGRSTGITSRWMTPSTSAVAQAAAKTEQTHPERLDIRRLERLSPQPPRQAASEEATRGTPTNLTTPTPMKRTRKGPPSHRAPPDDGSADVKGLNNISTMFAPDSNTP